ncbi:MAG TPA: cytochrome c3 family protein [Ignavibacteriaceae bacterium]|nr:cytochrome c3 family protein [Ignavibacteriaceae bacterium]
MKKKIIFIITFLIFCIAGFYIINANSGKNIESVPVSFSHYVHTKQHKIKCLNCHRNVTKEVRAGIPNIEMCSLCHSKIINPSSEKEKQVYNFVKNNKPIPWQYYYTVPDYVYFSHQRHVKIGKLDCVLCHGDMTEQTSPVLKKFTPIKMQFCFDCHKERNITTECGNCHH